jgi:hypothetical protein
MLDVRGYDAELRPFQFLLFDFASFDPPSQFASGRFEKQRDLGVLPVAVHFRVQRFEVGID